MPDILTFGGVQIGTHLVAMNPAIQRAMPPVEEDGVYAGSIRIADMGANLVHRPRFVVFHEEADRFAFVLWMIRMAGMMRAVPADVVASGAAGEVTWPKCWFVSFERPDSPSPAEERFSAQIAVNFVGSEDPH